MENLEPKLEWLQKELGLDDQALGKMISTAPVILGLSVEANLKPKLKWMKDTLGLDKKASTKLVMAVPSVLVLLQDTLDKKLAFLRGEELNLSDVSAFTAGWGRDGSREIIYTCRNTRPRYTILFSFSVFSLVAARLRQTGVALPNGNIWKGL